MVTRRSIESQEDAVIDFQFLLIDLLNKQNITKEELARRLNLSKKVVGDLFDSGANPTLKQIAEIFDSLNYKVSIKVDAV